MKIEREQPLEELPILFLTSTWRLSICDGRVTGWLLKATILHLLSKTSNPYKYTGKERTTKFVFSRKIIKTKKTKQKTNEQKQNEDIS